MGCEDIPLWFWLAFPWWLVILSIFSCICQPFVCLLLRMSIQVFCLFFDQIVFCFHLCFVLLNSCCQSKVSPLLISREFPTALDTFVDARPVLWIFHVQMACALSHHWWATSMACPCQEGAVSNASDALEWLRLGCLLSFVACCFKLLQTWYIKYLYN